MLAHNSVYAREVGDNEYVVMKNNVIGPRLRWDEVAGVMTPAKQKDVSLGGPSSPLQDQKAAHEGEDALPALFESMANDRRVGQSNEWLTGPSQLRSCGQSVDVAEDIKMIWIIVVEL